MPFISCNKHHEKYKKMKINYMVHTRYIVGWTPYLDEHNEDSYGLASPEPDPAPLPLPLPPFVPYPLPLPPPLESTFVLPLE